MLMAWIREMFRAESDEEDQTKDTDPTEPEILAADPASESGSGNEYRRGEFVVKGEQAQRLLKHDEQAKEVYDGVDLQIRKLRRIRKLAEQLSAKKAKASENG